MSSNVIPTLRYKDANAAIEFLTKAFGFEEHQVVRGKNNVVQHAELVYRDGMVMLGSAQETAYGDFLTTVHKAGKPTSGLYVVVDDVTAHAAQAEAAGASIVMPLTSQDYGGTDYTCVDPEGYVWSFGDYDPWKTP